MTGAEDQVAPAESATAEAASPITDAAAEAGGSSENPIQIDDEVKRCDEEIMRQNELTDAQLKQIEAEQKQTALVGDRIPFEVLIMEYDQQDSPDFHSKAKELAENYSEIRQIRRDGNCFYRSILAAQVELIYKDPEELARFESVCRGWQKRLVDLGFPDWTTADFCDTFYDFLTAIKNKDKNMKQVFEDMNDDNLANYQIVFLRLIASGYLQENTADYEPFIDCGKTLSEYCKTEIEGMWKDADHLAVTGLVNALGQGIRVEYMDRSAAPDGGCHYDFPPDQPDVPKITLLYRPGHYDLIYRK